MENSVSEHRSGDAETLRSPGRAPALYLKIFLAIIGIAVALSLARHYALFPFSTSQEVGAELFPSALSIGPGDLHVEIESDASLNPTADRDFLLVSWFQFRKRLVGGQRMILLSKANLETGETGGYALAVTGDEGGVRPLVYWNSEEGDRWYRFPQIQIPPRAWVMFAVSLRGGRSLGLHVATVTAAGKVDIELLGGYPLKKTEVLENKLPLMLAPPVANKFLGKIGPVGIFHSRDLTSNLRDIIKGLAHQPLQSPNLFKKREVSLWWTRSGKISATNSKEFREHQKNLDETSDDDGDVTESGVTEKDGSWAPHKIALVGSKRKSIVSDQP